MKFTTDLSTTSRGTQTGHPFSPARLFTGAEDGCWLDPSDPTTLFEDAAGTIPASIGGRVGRIVDKSGNGRDAVQTENAWARPFLRHDATGRPYLEFDGIDDVLTCDLSGLGNNTISATISCGFLALGSVGYILNASGDSTGGDTRSFNLLYSSDNLVELRVGGSGGSNTGAVLPNTPQCATATWDRAVAGGHVLWGRQAAIPITVGAWSQDHPLRIGARVSGAFFAGRVYGVVACKAGTDPAGLHRLRQFMCQKTGVAPA